MITSINSVYFSATGTTEKLTLAIASQLKDQLEKDHSLSLEHKLFNITLPGEREQPLPCFGPQDVVVVGMPVYAGRVPNVFVKYLQSLSSTGSPCIAVTVYGNRDFDDALVELADILENSGFKLIAAAAFIGEHSFSYQLAQGRPDKEDLALAAHFAQQVAGKVLDHNSSKPDIPGQRPYRPHYKPKDGEGNAVDFRKIKPETSDDCIDCKLCAMVCPMGSIDMDDVKTLTGICIKCCACIKQCPTQAKHFSSTDFIRHKVELERQFQQRKEPQLFL